MTNFRKFCTSSGKDVLSGKDKETNEMLIEQTEDNSIVLHTKKPGSPFVEIKVKGGKISKKDIEEAAIFCAKFSQDWKKNHKDVIIHVFKGKDIYKEKIMEEGTFGVKKFKEIKIKKEDIQKFEGGIKGR